MLKAILTRFRQGHRTMAYPDAPQPLPPRFRGLPLLDASRCSDGCRRVCAEACPYGAISASGPLTLDMGKCLFCCECQHACPQGAIAFTREYQLAAAHRQDLKIHESGQPVPEILCETARKVFRRSLKLRQVSAGGCNACEADTNVLGTVAWDLGRFGIQFVASPRHADGLLITGPVTENMRLALEKTYAAVPPPRIVIAVGACAVNGGPYIDHPEVHNGAPAVLPVDLFVPGCPPHPLTILDGLLRFLGKGAEASAATGQPAG